MKSRLTPLAVLLAGALASGPVLAATAISPKLAQGVKPQAGYEQVTERLPNDRASVVPETIPSRVVIEQMAHERAPVPQFAPGSSATTAYEALWARVQSRLAESG